VSVEQETGLVRLGGLERLGVLERLSVLEVVVTRGLMAVPAVASSSELVMAVAVVLIGLELLHVHNPLSCGHRGQPVSLVSPVPHAQAQVYHGY
jgi:hypothetical protein